MKNVTKFALAFAMVGGLAATAWTLDDASARGWDNNYQQNQQGRMGNMGQGRWNTASAQQQNQTWGVQRGGQAGMNRGQAGFTRGPAMNGRGAEGVLFIQQFDADKDGTLTKAELTAGLEAKITDSDKDASKSLSLAEFQNEWLQQTQQAMVRAFQRMDADGSGQITVEEIQAPALQIFAARDLNKDDKLDANEHQNNRVASRGQGFRMMAPVAPAPAPATE